MAAVGARFCQVASWLVPRHSLHTTKASKKAKTGADQIWLNRQKRDPYVKAAREHSFRCRSAYKLLEIDKEHKILQPGYHVIDCGAAPGAWSQVLVDKVNSLGQDPAVKTGFVLGLDLLHISPLDGALFLSKCDLTDPNTYHKIADLLPTGKADAILSDMAPNASGIRELDHHKLASMCTSLLDLAALVLRPGGNFLCKLWDGSQSNPLKERLRQSFQHVRTVKPRASRMESAEIYLLGKSYKGDQP